MFITTKIWLSSYGYEKAAKSIDASLARLQTDYVDLFLLHQPFGNVYVAYRALIEAPKEGNVRAIGVSNFYPNKLADRFVCRREAAGQPDRNPCFPAANKSARSFEEV